MERHHDARDPICFLSAEIDPGTPGGIGRLVSHAAAALDAAGWPPVLLLACDTEAFARFDAHRAATLPAVRAFHVATLLTGLPPRDDLPDWAFGYRPYHAAYRAALAAERLAQRIRLAGFEVPEYGGLGAVLLKRRRLRCGLPPDLPCWTRLHGAHALLDEADDRRDATPEARWIRSAEAYTLAHADAWIGPSDAMLRHYQCRFGGSRPMRSAVPPYHRLGTQRSHSGLRPQQGSSTFLFYGRLQRLKGADLFVHAAVRLLHEGVDARFVLAGADTPCSHRFTSYQAELQAAIPSPLVERFSFLGRVEPTDLPALAARCTAAVVPSRFETFCLAAHELNWIGIPLVLNDIPAFTDLFVHEQGCLKFDGTAAGLAAAMRRMIDDVALRNAWRPAPITPAGDLGGLYEQVLRDVLDARSAVEDVGGTHGATSASVRSHPSSPLEQPRGGVARAGPRVSVVVPYYEMQDYVATAIDAVQASTRGDWEIIVVNDGSPSQAARARFESLREKYSGDDRFRFIDKPNGGLSSARNAGIAVARGEYILPLDADDLIEPDLLERLTAALDANADLDAVSCFAAFFLDGRPPNQAHDYVIPYDLDPVMIAFENRAGVACSLFRRSVFSRLRYDETLFSYEDWDLWWSLIESGGRAEVLPMLLFRYRHRATSMVNTIALRRHAHLVSMIIDRHPRLIARHAPEMLRLYADRVTALRAARAGAPNADSVPAARLAELERIVEDLRHSPTWQFLQFLRNRLAFLRGLKKLVRFAQPQYRVQIRPTGQRANLAAGAEVWCLGVRTVAGRILPARPADSNGSWSQADVGVADLPAWMSRGDADRPLTCDVRGDGFAVLLCHHASGGHAELIVNGTVYEADTFAPQATAGLYEHVHLQGRWIVRPTQV